MAYGELIEHAQRLHALASSRSGTWADLVELRDLVPQLIGAGEALTHRSWLGRERKEAAFGGGLYEAISC